MTDEDKTEEQLIHELQDTRERIAQLKNPESEQKKSEELLNFLLPTLPIAIYTAQHGKFRVISPQLQKITGYGEAQLLGMDSLSLVHPEDRDMVKANAVKILKGERSSPYEFRLVAKNEEVIWILETVASTQYRGERATLGNFMDITRRKQAEIELHGTRELLSSILASSPVGICFVEDGRLKLANQTMISMFGFEHEEDYLNQSLRGIYASEEEYDRVRQIIRNQLKGDITAGIDVKLKRKDGSIFDGHLKVSIPDRSEPIKRAVASISDITWRKQAEAALFEEKERLAVTLRSIGDGVICTDNSGAIILMNKVAEKLTGRPEKESIGKSLNDVFHIVNEKTREPCENPVERVMETKGVVGLANHTILIARDGTERVLADSGAPIRNRQGQIIGVVLVFRDVTEQQKLEREIQKAEKLESIGILAGGIAHDFNNILTAILGNISLAKMYLHPDEADVIERLTDAEKASLQAKDLTQQLLTFSKGGAPVKKFVSMPKLIKDAASFVLRGSNVRCEFSVPDDLWPVEVDEGQINQVINNLIINADQAMPEGGVIKVRAENVLVEETGTSGLRPGEYIKLSIRDRGIGISKTTLSKIFDPYFSTKQKGSGLGLATAYSIIKNHDGDISVESELGVGTTFYIHLPASEKHIVPREEGEESLLAGKGKILIMDDEEMVRNVVGKMLKSIGYEVCLSTDGAEAIELYQEAADSGTPFDAVVMDLTIPGRMDGKEAIQRLLEIDPEARAIVSSGYSTDPVMADFKKYGFKGVAAKPYKLKELNEELHKVITEKVKKGSPKCKENGH